MQKLHENEAQVGKKSFDLVKGKFTPKEALEILSHLISTKINFHNLQIFSKHERTEVVDKHSIKRIEELEASKELIKELTLEAERCGKTLRLQSTIQIELV
ncbi:MAG: hypothetical protein ACO1OQ_03540 [Rufibacter sp.]